MKRYFTIELSDTPTATRTAIVLDDSPGEALASYIDQYPNARVVKAEWPAYTDIGGYPLYYGTKDGGTLCPACATAHYDYTLGDDPQWQIVEQCVNYESHTLVCYHCGDAIEAAYGDD